jgi:hypothetical protein
MGIQFFLGDASALLCGTEKASRTIFASDEGAVAKSRMYAGPTRLQAASQKVKLSLPNCGTRPRF